MTFLAGRPAWALNGPKRRFPARAEYYLGLPPADQEGLLACLASGVANPDSQMGCYACQPSDYDSFQPFFRKVRKTPSWPRNWANFSHL
jgi:hypothetical protein